jgi:NitT/TauT family transport system substrate-binding protein
MGKNMAANLKTLVLETTAPFQGLCELVADKEGLFEKEGLLIEWADRDKDVDKSLRTDITDPRGLDAHSSHGKLFEQGAADMYNACEWGNYCRVQDTQVDSGRQVGRRAIVTFAGIVVRPESDVYTAQQLAGKLVGVPFFFGTHYLTLHMLEGFMARDQIKLCKAPNGSRYRYEAMLSGEVEATTLTEPYLSLAVKNGCRVICSAFYHGTEVASDRVDADTYSRFNRAVKEAVKRVNADKLKYAQYFIDYHKGKDPEIGELKASDIPLGHIVVVDPAPIPEHELAATAQWIKSWGMLEDTENHLDLVNMEVQIGGHAAAE